MGCRGSEVRIFSPRPQEHMKYQTFKPPCPEAFLLSSIIVRDFCGTLQKRWCGLPILLAPPGCRLFLHIYPHLSFHRRQGVIFLGDLACTSLSLASLICAREATCFSIGKVLHPLALGGQGDLQGSYRRVRYILHPAQKSPAC